MAPSRTIYILKEVAKINGYAAGSAVRAMSPVRMCSITSGCSRIRSVSMSEMGY